MKLKLAKRTGAMLFVIIVKNLLVGHAFIKQYSSVNTVKLLQILMRKINNDLKLVKKNLNGVF